MPSQSNGFLGDTTSGNVSATDTTAGSGIKGPGMMRPKRQPLNFNKRRHFDNSTLIVGNRPPPLTHPTAVTTTVLPTATTTSSSRSQFGDTSSIVVSNKVQTPGALDEDLKEEFINYESVQLIIKFHDQKVSNHDVLVDLSMLPGAKEGDVAELEPLHSSSKKLEFIVRSMKDEDQKQPPQQQQQQQQQQSQSQSQSQPQQIYEEQQSQPQQQRPTISISSSSNLQLIMDLQAKSPVLVRLKNKKDIEADVVELYIKDIHLTRGDMWIFQSMLTGRCVYKSERVNIMDNGIRAYINGIYRNGHKVFSAYVGQNTKFVFRSESSKLIFLIQLSKEMWDFEESGEIMFQKLINSLFPKIFKKWQEMGRHHLITIVLFASVDLTSRSWNDLEPGERLSDTKDFYRVVVDQVNILLWSKIMSNLRLEFANFMKDVRLANGKLIEGVFVSAIKGNILEAINMATTLVTDHFRDPDLRHTTNHFILITPSTGLFDVNYKLMVQTSRKMLAIDSALDIICLSQPPLHVVPLFRYKDFNFKTQHCIPSWIDVSFWSDSNQTINQWIPRCKIYEIQMMGVMENEMSDVSIAPLNPTQRKKNGSLLDAMQDYDNNIFKEPTYVATSASASTTQQQQNAHQNHQHPQITEIRPHTSPMLARSDTSIPQLQKKKSLESLEAAYKPHSAAVATKLVSNATTSQDVVFGVTNSRSNITAFTSLLNLQKKPSVSNFFSTAELPKLIRPNSSAAVLNKDKNGDIFGDDDTIGSNKPPLRNVTSMKSDTFDPIKNLRNFTMPSSKSIPIRSQHYVPRGSPAPDDNTDGLNPDNSSPVFNHHQNLNVSQQHHQLQQQQQQHDRDKKSASSSFESRLISTSPSRLQATMQLERKSTEATKRPYNIAWTAIENPSVAIDPASVTSLTSGRWEHVFPKNVKRRAIKWTSLSSPAALPITTTHFPNDFQTNFTFKLYDIILNTNEVHDSINSGDLMRDMIYLRLCLGFQIIIGDRVNKIESKRKPGGDPSLLVKFVKHQKYEGSRIYMSYDDEIHRICIDYNNNINVQIYKRSKMASFDTEVEDDEKIEYAPKIRTRYDEEYRVAPINALAHHPQKYNWNHLDQTLAGYDDSLSDESTGNNKYKLKFVILPGPISENSIKFGNDQLSSEEIRLEGLRKLIAHIYKGRYKSPEEIRRKGSDLKEELTPEINFYTGSLFKFLQDQSVDYFNKDSLFVDHDSLHLHYDVKLTQLALLLQNPKTGINFVDRKWHWKTHRNCFLGLELVNWMVKNIDEVISKDDAVNFGNKLMEENLFSHVENRHTFLDGHYFYKLNPEYIVEIPNNVKSPVMTPNNKNSISSSTSNNAGGTSSIATNTPAANATTSSSSATTANAATAAAAVQSHSNSQVSDLDTSPSNNWFTKRESKSSVSSDSDSTLKQNKLLMTPRLVAQDPDASRKNSESTTQGNEPRKVKLSRSLVYDVDPSKKSYKPELVTVHYDRVHNLEHCFHIRLEWLNTTVKLIDDTVMSWSRLCERYGLRFVEVPWNELVMIPTRNPFHSFVDIQLALNPWLEPQFTEGTTGQAILAANRFYYHTFLLEKSGFLLDNRAAVFFGDSQDIEVSYSWGNPTFKYAQYIHSTGAYIAEIKDTGELFLAPNNTHVARVNVLQTQRLVQGKPNKILDSQRVMLEFRQTCKDANRLREIFQEAKSQWETNWDTEDVEI